MHLLLSMMRHILLASSERCLHQSRRRDSDLLVRKKERHGGTREEILPQRRWRQNRRKSDRSLGRRAFSSSLCSFHSRRTFFAFHVLALAWLFFGSQLVHAPKSSAELRILLLPFVAAAAEEETHLDHRRRGIADGTVAAAAVVGDEEKTQLCSWGDQKHRPRVQIAVAVAVAVAAAVFESIEAVTTYPVLHFLRGRVGENESDSVCRRYSTTSQDVAFSDRAWPRGAFADCASGDREER